MENNLTVTLLQADLEVDSSGDNLNYFSNLIDDIELKGDLIILPELFTYGYSRNIRELVENMQGKTVNWMLETACNLNVSIIGSVAIKENENNYNRLIIAYPDGKIEHYDKRHLFRMENEHKILDYGKDRVIVEYKGWKICPLICYDLRFPVWSRKKSRDEYDLLIYVANWPQARSYHWKSLLAARAIENQAFAIGVNRCGKDIYGTIFSGDSMLIDPYGKVLSDLREGERAATLTIEKTIIEEARSGFPTWMDMDIFEIEM